MMDRDAIAAAVGALVEARRTGRLLEGLPADARPASVDDAHAIQDATVATLGDAVAGWKVLSIEGRVARGVLLRSRVLTSPATVAATQVPLLGVEAEIAFRFDRDLPPRDRDYSYDDVSRSVTAMAAIEVVDSRFRDYAGTALLDRLADCASNGAFIHGGVQARWRDFDLLGIHVELGFDGRTIVKHAGGHAARDPLLPAVALVNALREAEGVRAGQLMTTGTYTGLNYARPGQAVTAAFAGLEPVAVRFAT